MSFEAGERCEASQHSTRAKSQRSLLMGRFSARRAQKVPPPLLPPRLNSFACETFWPPSPLLRVSHAKLSLHRLEPPGLVCIETVHPVDAAQSSAGWVSAVEGDVDAEVDGLGEEEARRIERHLFEELADAIEHGAGVVGVDGGEPTRVPGVPRLDELEGGRPSPDLADDDPVWPRPERVHDGSLPTVDGFLDEDLELVRRGALELAHVLDDVEPVAGLGRDLVEDGVRESSLAGAGGATDEDVGAIGDGARE